MEYLPTPNEVAYLRYNVALSGASYGVRFMWNGRDSAWYFGLDDPSGDPLVSSVRVVLNTDLLQAVPDSDRRPPYGILVVDPTGGTQEPTFETIAGPIALVYLEPEDEDEDLEG